jgi:uncharacterized protein (DUF1501 family)
MRVTRREFFWNGISAAVAGVTLPRFVSDLARAQGASARNLVVLNLSGGNDGLSMLVPYTDPFYYSRRPTLAIPAGTVLQVGSDASGKALGLHPRLGGLMDVFRQGRLALIQRVGYANSSRSHFQGTDIWSTANPENSQGPGWLGQYLGSLGRPVDPLVAWNTLAETPHALQSPSVSVASIPNVVRYAFNSPNTGSEAVRARAAAQSIASHLPSDQPLVAFVATTAQAAMSTLDRVATVGQYRPSVVYPANGFGQALQVVAGAMSTGIGTKVFFVQTGGFDNHAGQETTGANGTYVRLMGTLNDGLTAFYNDLRNTGLINETLVLSFSEFGRRVGENGSRGTDHGAASVMLAMGGRVRGGLYGTAPSLNPDPQNPTLENRGNDVHYETDFRSAYAKVIDDWLGGNSAAILGGNFRAGSIDFV